MPYTPLQVSIPEPCHVPWNGMTPVTDNTRHCASCDKVITDFSHMTDAQIGRTLKANGGKICGRFRNDQLGRPLNLEGPRRRRGLGAFAAAASMLLTAPALAQAPEQVKTEQRPVSAGHSTPRALEFKPVKVTGTVTDETGEPMIGASVYIPAPPNGNGAGFLAGTVADYDGRFELTFLPTGSDEIVVSYTGYADQRIALDPGKLVSTNGELQLDIVMDDSCVMLGDVVVTGYSVMGKTYITGGIVVLHRSDRPSLLENLMVHKIPTIRTDRPLGPAKTGDWKDYWRDLFAARKARRAERKAERIAQRAARLATRQEDTRPPSPAPESSPRTRSASSGTASGPAPNLGLTASPNPFGQELTVRFVIPSAQRVRLALFDANGRAVLERTYDRPAGEQSIRLEKMPLKLPAGTYFLRLMTVDGTTETVTVVR